MIHAVTTIGEIDFLLREKINRKAIHLEFALKYYLAIEDGGVMRYIGPKGRDSLEGKSVKLLDHQLKLCSNHSELLDKELRKFHFEPKLLLKGFIFYPYGSKEDCWWIRQKDLNRIELEERNEYYIFKQRRDWIFPYDPRLREKCLKSNKFLDELLDSEQLPLLCLTVSKEGKENLLMVVADQWPKEEV